jgi:hypothetical protein
METDYISREAAIEKITALINESGKYTAYESGADDACFILEHEIPAADVVEVVRCRDCKYWRDAYVVEKDGTERQYRDDDVDPLGMRGVTVDIGINIGSMCLLENNCGWELNKSIFRNENDFCSRGEKRPYSYEKWWGIVDGIYPKPDIKEG